MSYTRTELNDFLSWDVRSWSKAIYAWSDILPESGNEKIALEIGANKGGLSLFLSLKGYRVICSDLESPENNAKELHQKYINTGLIEYNAIDAENINFPDNKFDVLIFKSILGAVGRKDQIHKIEKALSEMYRVLKPNGLLLFAENTSASKLHQLLRRNFIKWGQNWFYLPVNTLVNLLSSFREVEYNTHGSFSLLGRSEWQRNILSYLDDLICPFIPKKKRYIIYGYARK